MYTQKEYMNLIKKDFVELIEYNKGAINAYNYRDKRATIVINKFKDHIKLYGLQLSNCYHANGIGNNNEYTIFIETKDADGFVIQKNIASFYYCYGIYGGCYVRLEDLSTKERFEVGRAR